LHDDLIADLAIVTAVAAVTAILSRRLGQPTILGYLLAGLIVGPYIPIPLFADPHRVETLAEVGVILVMFAVGLEFRIGRLLAILPTSGLTAAAQIGGMLWLGSLVGDTLGWSSGASLCLGACVAISSTMVVSTVLRAQPLDDDVREHVFGVLVVQDLVAIVLMAIVTGIAGGEAVELRSLGVLVGQLLAVMLTILVGGLLVLPRLVRFVLARMEDEVLVVVGAGAAFGLAMVAGAFGYSVALGAFLAGIAVSESGKGHEVAHALEPLRALFAAIFFVSIGMSVDPRVAWSTAPLALAVSAVVVIGQLLLVSTTTVLTGGTLRRGVLAGLGLGQIGELSFILAGIAIAGGVFPDETLPMLVTVATVTAFTTPLFLRRSIAVVDAIDRRIPDRTQSLLTAYQAFVRRAREAGDGPSMSRPMVGVLLDWIALMLLLVTRSTLIPRVEDRLYLDVAIAVMMLPFLVGLVRSGRTLVNNARTLAHATFGQTRRASAVQTLVLLSAVVGIGLPTLALIQTLVTTNVELGFLAALVLVSIALGSRAARDSEHSSGVARLAVGLAEHVQDDELTMHFGGALTGLDFTPVSLTSPAADGKTLAELDLRSRTGATIVAVERGGETTTLPTGHEQLAHGDVLAVSGSEEAISRARTLLCGGVEDDGAALE